MRLNTKKKRLSAYIGISFVILGLLIATGAAQTIARLVVLGVDTVAPTISSTTPSDKSAGYMSTTFLETKKYSCRVVDSTSGAAEVKYQDAITINQGTEGGTGWVHLSKVSGTIYDGIWSASFPTTVSYTENVDYSFKFYAKDVAGNIREVSGTFRIYTQLTGDWFINDVKVTSPTQEIWLKTTSVTFKFIKIAGVPDSGITCTLSGGTTGTLSYISANTWSLTKTLSDGIYDIQMKAYDGTTTVTMTILGVQIGEPFNPDTIIAISGWALLVAGLSLLAYSRFSR